MKTVLLDPTREQCAYVLDCDDLCPCWAPADYEVIEPGIGPFPACTSHANSIREEAERLNLSGIVIRSARGARDSSQEGT